MSLDQNRLDEARRLISRLTPDEKAKLLRELRATVIQEEAADRKKPKLTPEQQKENLTKLLEHFKTLPIQSPDDGFSGADHDRILYGDPS